MQTFLTFQTATKKYRLFSQPFQVRLMTNLRVLWEFWKFKLSVSSLLSAENAKDNFLWKHTGLLMLSYINQKLMDVSGTWWRRKWQPTPVFLLRKSRGQRSLVGYSPWGWKRVRCDFSSVQSLSHVRLFATPWIAARQASLSITNSWNSLRLTSIELVMPSSHLILCGPLLLLPPNPPSIRVFSNESTQSIGVSALTSVLPKKSQSWSPSEWTDWISLQSKGLSRVFSNTTVQKHQFFSAQLSSQSNSHIHTWPQEKP